MELVTARTPETICRVSNDPGRVDVRIMNEYSCDMPLWSDGGQTDGEEFDLSAQLRRDLELFAARWDAAIPPTTFDDRFDHMPPVRAVVNAGRAVASMMQPGRRRAAIAEDAAMRHLGEDLRARLQVELGESYRVTYQHG